MSRALKAVRVLAAPATRLTRGHDPASVDQALMASGAALPRLNGMAPAPGYSRTHSIIAPLSALPYYPTGPPTRT